MNKYMWVPVALVATSPAFAQTVDTTDALANIALALVAVTAIGGAILGALALVKAFGISKAATV